MVAVSETLRIVPTYGCEQPLASRCFTGSYTGPGAGIIPTGETVKVVGPDVKVFKAGSVNSVKNKKRIFFFRTPLKSNLVKE